MAEEEGGPCVERMGARWLYLVEGHPWGPFGPNSGAFEASSYSSWDRNGRTGVDYPIHTREGSRIDLLLPLD